MAFKSLVSVVSEQCHEIKQTLSSIPYFDTWDETAIADCCRLSSLEEFPPQKVILGSGAGNSHTVYFILDGVCRMIHYLQVETRINSKGEIKYNLYKSVGESLNSDAGSVEYTSLLFNEKHEFQTVEETKQKVEEDESDTRIETIDETEPKDTKMDRDIATTQSDGTGTTQSQVDKQQEELKNETNDMKKDFVYDEDHHLKVLQQCREKLQKIICVNKKDTNHERPKTVNGYFIQTGFLLKGACFGLKKYTDKDFILSETRVKCLKIPHRFLLQHNPCNIWNRILLFDSLYQPKEEKILECFETDRKWLEGKKKLTESIISRKEIPIYTSISDVPYSIRLTDLR